MPSAFFMDFIIFRYCNVVWQRYIINLKNQSMKREIFARIIDKVSEETQLSRESILSKNMFFGGGRCSPYRG